MARVTLNIAKKYDEGFIEDIERTKYFQLHKNATQHSDLYTFVIAIAEMEGKSPKPIQEVGSVKSFVRTETLTNCEPLFSCLYFDKVLKDNLEKIDDICNRDEIYNFVEQYANTGFGILENWTENIDEETLFYKLIGYMDKKYDEIIDEVKSLI